MALDSIIIAQVNANTAALNKINEDARKTSELPLLPVLDATDLIRIEQAGISYKAAASQFLPPNSEFLEYIYNKQNDLSPDGTGVMYPTVDAVIEGLSGFLKTDKIDDKTLKQTGLYRPDADVSVLSISPADTLNITAVNQVLFINEIFPDSPTNLIDDYLKDFGDKTFVANATNTLLAANTRGIFYVGVDKLGNQVYRTSKFYDQDICYLARLLVANTAGVYSVVSFKYFPDLANNKINNHDRFIMYSGGIVPSGAASISFGNRGVTFGKNSINYSINKFDPNFLSVADSVNPAPMQFLFALPNISSLAVNIALSTTINPAQWYTAGGAVGGTAVGGANYQVYRLLVSVTGTLIIQTKASTSNAPAAGINAIFANRDDALAGLTSVVWPDILPFGDAIPLGTFYLRAGTAVNGSQLTDPNDFYFNPYIATASSSSVGVTVHDLLSGKNDNPAFQHVTTTDISNWNSKPAGAGVNGQVTFWSGASTQSGDNGLFWDNANKKLGIGVSTIDAIVKHLKVGDGIPSSDNSIIAFTKTYNIVTPVAPTTIGNYGVNAEFTGIAQSNVDGRAVVTKYVSYIDPNGFNLTNSGGSAIGMEGVARLKSTAGGFVEVITGGYFRVLNDNDILGTGKVGIMAGIVIPTHGGFSTNPADWAIGATINEQNWLGRANRSVNLIIGSPNLGAYIPPEMISINADYSIYNLSVFPNYFKGKLGLNVKEPAEMLDINGNAKATSFIKTGALATDLLAGTGVTFSTNNIHQLRSTYGAGGQNIDTLITSGNYILSGAATGTKPAFVVRNFIVYKSQEPASSFITQVAYGETSGRSAARSSNDVGVTWSAWLESPTGTGTTNVIPKWISPTVQGDSNITDIGSLITLNSDTRINGNVGLQTAPAVNMRMQIGGLVSGATSAYVFLTQPTIQPDVTTTAYLHRSVGITAVAGFTLTNLVYNHAGQGNFGAGSIVTNQSGYIAENTLIGATNNYGFVGNIPAGANRWNIYMGGTAQNYFAGNVGIAGIPVTSATDKLQVNGNITANAATTANHVIIKSQFDAFVSSGVWTPTITLGSNTATPTFISGTYSKVGNIVTCKVSLEIVVPAMGVGNFNLTLPINKLTGSLVNAGTGTAYSNSLSNNYPVFSQVTSPSTVNAQVKTTAGANENLSVALMFQYDITS